MAEMVELAVQPREEHGTRAARKLRKKGMVPGVVYGHKEATISVVLPAETLEWAIRHGARVVDLKSDGKVEKALIRAVQWDHLGKELLHVDFNRVAADERVVVTVPVELRGQAPGVTSGGGVIDQPIHTLAVECLVTAVPDHIRVNISELQVGSAIHIKELVLPPGVKAMADPETVVVLVKVKLEEAAAPAPVAAPTEAAEPEVIGRKVAAPEEEEGKEKEKK